MRCLVCCACCQSLPAIHTQWHTGATGRRPIYARPPAFVWATTPTPDTLTLSTLSSWNLYDRQINILDVLLSKFLNLKTYKLFRGPVLEPVYMQERLCVWTVRLFVDVQYLLYMGSRWHYRWPLCVSSCPLAEPQHEGALIWSNWAVGRGRLWSHACVAMQSGRLL